MADSPARDCPPEADLARYVAGACQADSAERISRHIDQCPQCRQRINDEHVGAGYLRRALGSGPPGPDDESDADRIDRPARQSRTGGTSIPDLITQGLLEPFADPAYPARLGPYHITEYVGRGGMGIVLKARDPGLDREVALKILRPELTDDDLAVARFTREAKAAARLRHPNVVRVYHVGTERGLHYLVMEYVAGPTLAQRIKDRGPLPTDLVREIFRQLLAGLGAAHDAGLIHRDVKSSNILLDEPQAAGPAESPVAAGVPAGRPDLSAPHPTLSTQHSGLSTQDSAPNTQHPGPSPQHSSLASAVVKLADFGLARMVSAQTRLTLGHATPGTPEYMSPEQARGLESLDHRTDLYSAGVVLYEMLTGRTPFKADTPAAVIHRILHEDPPDPRTLNPQADPNLATLALRLTAKRCADRPDSACRVLHLLDAPGRLRPPGPRQAYLRWSVAVLGCIGLLGFGFLAHLWGGDTQPPIIHVSVGTVATGDANIVYAETRAGGAQNVFYTFDRGVVLSSAAVATIPGGDGQMVVAGAQKPADEHCLFGFSARGAPIWSYAFRPPSADWPDCDPTENLHWACHALDVADFNGIPGQGIIAAVSDRHEYPTAVLVLDAGKGTTLFRFGHMGHLTQIMGVSHYFGPGLPAIVSWGQNNKLDGFGDPPAPDYQPPTGTDRPVTQYDVVPVVVILDPRKMNGSGPPQSPKLSEFGVAKPFAYAFLDMPIRPMHGKYWSDDGTHRITPPPTRCAHIEDIEVFRPRNGRHEDLELWVRVEFEDRTVPGAILVVDRDLDLVTVTPASGAVYREEHWRAVWRPIVQPPRPLSQ